MKNKFFFDYQLKSWDTHLKPADLIQKYVDTSLSLRKIKSLIDIGALHVNGRLSLNASKPLAPPANITWNIPHFTFLSHLKSLDILYEDAELILLHKPSGVLSHSDKPGVISCQSILRQQLKNKHVEVVHRLDQYTSGVLLAGKHSSVTAKLLQLFKNRLIKKEYLAITSGNWREHSETLNTYLAPVTHRSGQSTFMVSKKASPHNKHAVTHIKVLSSKQSFSLVLFKPLTGRTHQLRVHAAYLNCPILGDWLYSPLIPKGYHPGRYLLHAASLEFVHPVTEKIMHVSCPMPHEFKYFLDLLKLPPHENVY